MELIHLDKQIIEQVAGKVYQIEADEELFSDEFNAAVARRGHLTRDELVKIATWKSPRQKTNVAKNHEDTIKHITSRAFAEPEPYLAAWTLNYLYGVHTRMASAILTVFDQEKYTVMDYRARDTLARIDLSVVNTSMPEDFNLDSCNSYMWYLQTCRGLADHYDVSLRDLDRCLFSLAGQAPVLAKES